MVLCACWFQMAVKTFTFQFSETRSVWGQCFVYEVLREHDLVGGSQLLHFLV